MKAKFILGPLEGEMEVEENTQIIWLPVFDIHKPSTIEKDGESFHVFDTSKCVLFTKHKDGFFYATGVGDNKGIKLEVKK